MAKKTLDNINKVPETPSETKLKSRTSQTTKFLTSFKPKSRFRKTLVEDSDPTIVKPRSIDLIQLSITIVLAIIALWSAYFVTRLLSTDSAPFESITKIFTQTKDKMTNEDKAVETNKNNLVLDQTEPAKTNSEEKLNNKNPFAPTDGTENKTTSVSQEAPTPTVTPEIAKNSFNIRILNGNGITGNASKFKKILADQGFKVGTIGNARLKYSKTQIYYISGQEGQANLVKDGLPDHQVELSQQGQDLVGQSYQVLVVLGQS